MEQEKFPRSLLGEKDEVINRWIRMYLWVTGLRVDPQTLISEAMKVEGIHDQVTKTRARKARLRILNRR